MEFGPASDGRLLVGLLVLGAVAAMAGLTLDPGRWRTLVWVLMGFFAFRMLLHRAGTR